MRTRWIAFTAAALGATVWAQLALAGVGAAAPAEPRMATNAVADAVAAVAAATPDEVVSVVALPDGHTDVARYTPAPGVSADRLRAQLTALGVRGVVQPDPARAQPRDVFTCYYGSAYALEAGRCPAASWRYNGRGNPLVQFSDHTPAPWPVSWAAGVWDTSPAVDVRYGFNRCSTEAGAHCVDVRTEWNAANWVGMTYWRLDAQRAFVDAYVWVRFNERYAGIPTGQRQAAACHELGHALGVGHNTATDSCMYSSVADYRTVPNSNDWGLLQNVLYRY